MVPEDATQHHETLSTLVQIDSTKPWPESMLTGHLCVCASHTSRQFHWKIKMMLNILFQKQKSNGQWIYLFVLGTMANRRIVPEAVKQLSRLRLKIYMNPIKNPYKDSNIIPKNSQVKIFFIEEIHIHMKYIRKTGPHWSLVVPLFHGTMYYI